MMQQSTAAACTLCREVIKMNGSRLQREQHSMQNLQKPAKRDANRLRTRGTDRRDLDISHGTPVEVERLGECMFHHCLNWHGTPPNVTDQQRRAFVMIFMAKDVCYNNAQAPGHILVPTIEVADGEPLVGGWIPGGITRVGKKMKDSTFIRRVVLKNYKSIGRV